MAKKNQKSVKDNTPVEPITPESADDFNAFLESLMAPADATVPGTRAYYGKVIADANAWMEDHADADVDHRALLVESGLTFDVAPDALTARAFHVLAEALEYSIAKNGPAPIEDSIGIDGDPLEF